MRDKKASPKIDDRTKDKSLKELNEVLKRWNRVHKNRRDTVQIRISRSIHKELKKIAKEEKKTISKTADKIIKMRI